MRPLLVTLALALSLLAGLVIGQGGVVARDLTPIPGRHAEVRTAFPFLVKDVSNQLGWRVAEYKDEGGQQYWKADAAPGCGAWSVVQGDARPGLTLTPGGTNCAGFIVEYGVLYWFSTPPISVTPSPVLSPPATVTDPPRATAIPSPTVASGVTVIPPSPPGGSIPTLSPAQERAFTVYCDRSGRPYGMTIWGSYGLTYSVPDDWCAGSRAASEELLRRMREATPAWVEVRP